MKGYHAVLVLIAAGLLGVFCLKPPAIPQWDVDVNVPLYQGTFRLASVLDTGYFRIQPDSSVSFARKFPIDTAEPAQLLHPAPVEGGSRIAVSDFTFSAQEPVDVGLGLEEILGSPIPDSGVKANILPFVSTIARTCSLPRIAEAEFVAGVAQVSACNQTDLEFDSLVVESPFGRLSFFDVEARSVRSARLDLAGIGVCSPFPVTTTIGSAGTHGDSVQLSKRDSVVVGITLDSLRLGSGRLMLDGASGDRQIDVTNVSSLPFRVDSLHLAHGTCVILVTNEMDAGLDASLEVTRLGISRDCHVEPRQCAAVEIDLGGLVLTSSGPDDPLLSFRVQAEPVPTGGYVTLGKADGVTVVYETKDLETENLVGQFRQPVYMSSGLDTVLRVPLGINGVRVSSLDVQVEAANEVGFPVELLVRGVALRGGCEVAAVQQNLLLPAGQPGLPSRSEFLVPAAGLINAGPEAITIEYTNRMTGSGRYEAGSTLAGEVFVSTPMRMALAPDTIVTPGRALRLGEAERRLREEHLTGARAEVALSCRMPVASSGRLVLAPDTTVPRASGTLVDSIAIPFSMPTGMLDCHGICIAETDTTLEMELDSVELSLFNTAPLLARVVVELPASDTVTVMARDRLSFNALLTLRLRTWE